MLRESMASMWGKMKNIESSLVDLRLDSKSLKGKILHKMEVEISVDIFFLIINFLWSDL